MGRRRLYARDLKATTHIASGSTSAMLRSYTQSKNYALSSALADPSTSLCRSCEWGGDSAIEGARFFAPTGTHTDTQLASSLHDVTRRILRKARSWFLIFRRRRRRIADARTRSRMRFFPVSNAFFSSRTRVWICLMEATFRLSALSSTSTPLDRRDATRFAGLLCSGTNAFLVSKFELGTDAVSSPSLLFSQIHLDVRPSSTQCSIYTYHKSISIKTNHHHRITQ